MLRSLLAPPQLLLPMQVTAHHHPDIDLWALILHASPQGATLISLCSHFGWFSIMLGREQHETFGLNTKTKSILSILPN